jgi:CBS domain-containing protein
MERKIVPDVIGQQQLVMLPSSATVREAAICMSDRQVGAVLVTRDGALEGIFTERDLLHRVVAPGRERPCEVMTSIPTRSKPTTAIGALSRMSERGYRHLPVSRPGRLAGIGIAPRLPGRGIVLVEEEYGHEQRF